MKSFNFIFSLNMMDPILKWIVKESGILQAKQLNLLTAVSLITSLKTALKNCWTDNSLFNIIYDETFKFCISENISIPVVKKRKVSCLLENMSSSSQTFHETIKEIKINYYNIALDNTINGPNERFSQETLSVIYLLLVIFYNWILQMKI